MKPQTPPPLGYAVNTSKRPPRSSINTPATAGNTAPKAGATQQKWTVEIHHRGYFNGLYQIWDKDGNSPKDDEAMRVYVETAVNCHAELVEALKEGKKAAEALCWHTTAFPNLRARYTKIEQALLNARGQEGTK